MKLALTGGIACGKSLLSKFMNELGVETLDADDIVHELIPDPAERRRIAAEVFADPVKRKELEARLHPIVKARIDEWLSRAAERKACGVGDMRDASGVRPHVALDTHVPRARKSDNLKIAVIPLLFEAHWEENFDIICCVVSKRENQIERMVTTRAMTRAEAEARLAAQMSVEEKARRSHYVIHNDGSPEELKSRAEKFINWLNGERHDRHRTRKT